MVRAHWIDVGGTSTGFGAGPEVPDPWQEGLQLDQLKIYRAGELDETLYRVIRDNIRFPNRPGRPQLADRLVQARRAQDRRAVPQVRPEHGASRDRWDLRRNRDEVPQGRRAPADGVYEAESFFDDDGVTLNERVRIHAKVAVKSGTMTIDLSGCSAERKAAVNSRTLAAARVAYKALTGPLDPVNEGSFRALEVIIPEATS